MSTEKPRPLTGYRESQETRKDNPVDPKKFQDAMKKVSESDASEQGKKRQLKKSEEEGEEDVVAATLPSPGSGFSDLMSGQTSDSILSPKTPQNMRAATTTTNSSQFKIEQDSTSQPPSGLGEQQPEPTPSAAPQTAAAGQQAGYVESPLPKAPTDQSPTPQNEEPSDTERPGLTPPAPAESDDFMNFDETPTQTLQEPEESAPSTQGTTTDETKSPERVQKKEEKDTSLMADKTQTTAQIAKKKKEKSPEIKVQKGATQEEKPPEKVKKASDETLTKKPEEKLVKEAESKKTTITAKDLEKESTSGKTPPQAAKEAAPITVPQEKQNLPASKEKVSEESTSSEKVSLGGKSTEFERDEGSSHDQKEEEKDQFVNLEGVITPDQAAFQTGVQQMPETPSYTNLNPQVFELFERMVGSMMIQIHDKGHTQTTVTINMKGSVFDGSKIVLDRYSSAPNSFNIEISTTPKGREMLMGNMNLLTESFAKADLNFEVSQLRTTLLESHRGDFTRKGAASGDDEGDSSGGQNKEQQGR